LNTLSQQAPGRRALATLSFGATLVAAWLLRWEAGDLMWGAYLSSLCYGYTYGILLIVANPDEVDAPAGSKRPWVILGMLAFFSFHFLMFHLFQGIVLTTVFPISPGTFDFLPAAFAAYWLVVAATFLSRADEIWSATQPSDDTLRLVRPYVNVARMQALVFILLFMQSLGVIRYAVYPVLVLYFVPFPGIGQTVKRWFSRLEDRMNDPNRGGGGW
jgi:hypothetical protein